MPAMSPDKLLVEAITYQAAQPTRGEFEEDPLAYFVDFDHYAPLLNPQWQFVLGRRGTGKTLLLRKLAEDLAPDRSALCVYVDLQQLGSDDDLLSLGDRPRANFQFARFLSMLADRLIQEVEASEDRIPGRDREEALLAVLQVLDSPRLTGASAPHGTQALRPLFTKLFRRLGFSRVILLLDEWSALDPTAETQLQPLFADSLRRLFWKMPGLSVKIAAVPTQLRTSVVSPTGAVLGLELGHDMEEAVDLDVIYRRRSAVSLFHELLNRRLAENLARSSGRAHPVIREDYDFVGRLFSDARAFQEIALSAEYLPRRFLSAHHDMQHRWLSIDDRPAWNVSFVRDIARRRAERHVTDLSRDSSMLSFLSGTLRPLLLDRDQRVFAWDRSRADLGHILRALEGQRFIHPTLFTFEGDSEGQFPIMQIDYGLWLSWRGKPASGYPPNWFVSPYVVRKDFRSHILVNLSTPVAPDITCPTCLAVFAADSRSYHLRGLCPNCYEPVARPLAG